MAAVPVASEVATRPDRRPTMLAVGTVVWLASELMFFAGLFASYFTIKSNATDWPGPRVHLSTARDAAFTAVLVLSSFTMQHSVGLLRRDRKVDAARWIALTFALGAIFLANQLYEWTQLPFRPSTSAYGSLFFIMTGFHGQHVLFGLVAMVGLLLRIAVAGSGDRGVEPASEVITYYWHFVDVVWIGLFVTLFFIK